MTAATAAIGPPPTLAERPARRRWVRPSVLPGFGLALGYTVLYLSLIVLIPLSATFFKSATLGWEAFWATVTAPRVLAALALAAACMGKTVSPARADTIVLHISLA